MKFEDLEAWQKSRSLTNAVYTITRKGPLTRDFGLRDQLQRAAVSCMNNIAEGFERKHSAEKLQFYNVAKASAGETRSMMYVLLDNNLSEPEEIIQLQTLAEDVGALTQGLIDSWKKKQKLQIATGTTLLVLLIFAACWVPWF
jgi:four helix bundle protein